MRRKTPRGPKKHGPGTPKWRKSGSGVPWARPRRDATEPASTTTPRPGNTPTDSGRLDESSGNSWVPAGPTGKKSSRSERVMTGTTFTQRTQYTGHSQATSTNTLERIEKVAPEGQNPPSLPNGCQRGGVPRRGSAGHSRHHTPTTGPAGVPVGPTNKKIGGLALTADLYTCVVTTAEGRTTGGTWPKGRRREAAA